MDDKKVVNTQHVKYIETLSRTRNSSLLNPVEGGFDDTRLAPATTNSHPVVEVSEPSTLTVAETMERMTTRTTDKWKPSRRVCEILSSFIETLEIDESDENIEAVCCAVETSLGPPNSTAAMKISAAGQWKIAIENELQACVMIELLSLSTK
jgi:hypothetical protein